MAIANGTPAIVLRQPTDTRKGQMWRNVGLNDWIFKIDDTAPESRSPVASWKSVAIRQPPGSSWQRPSNPRATKMNAMIANRLARLDSSLNRDTPLHDVNPHGDDRVRTLGQTCGLSRDREGEDFGVPTALRYFFQKE